MGSSPQYGPIIASRGGYQKPPLIPKVTGGSDAFIDGILQHRLFRGALHSADNNDEDRNNFDEGERNTRNIPSSLCFNELLQYNKDEDVVDDEEKYMAEYALISYSDSVEPRDRDRWACFDSNSTNYVSDYEQSIIHEKSSILTCEYGDNTSITQNGSNRKILKNGKYHLKVRVTGGWMKKVPDDDSVEANDYFVNNSLGSKSFETIAQEVFEKRIKLKLSELNHENPSQSSDNLRDFYSSYKRKLLEGVVNCSLAQSKKRFVADPIAALGKAPDLPLLFYVPNDDGGLNSVCISCAPQPVSLHKLCTEKDVCAYCFTPFQSGMKLYSEAQIMDWIRRKKRKKGNNVKKRKQLKKRKLTDNLSDDKCSYSSESDCDDEEFLRDNPRFLVTKTVGSVSYTIHRQCAYVAGGVTNNLLISDARETSELSDTNGFNNVMNVCSSGRGYELGPLYEYDEGDEGECDLCGRAGGILQFFDLDSRYSSQKPPGEEGWLAHVACLLWLSKSRLLELPPIEVRHIKRCDPNSMRNSINGFITKLPTEKDSNVVEIMTSHLEVNLNDSAEDSNVTNGIDTHSISDASNNPRTLDNIQPSSPQNNIQPSSPQNNIQPSSPQNNIQPSSPQNNIQPSSPQNDIQPSSPHKNIQPSSPQNNIQPSSLHNNIQPSSPQNNIQPSSPQYNIQPSSPQNNIQPSSPQYNIQPSSPQNNIPPSSPQYNIQPSSPQNNIQPSSPQNNIQPLPSENNVESAVAESEILLDTDVNTMSSQPLSLFDSLFGKWRCSLCGTSSGVTLKCAAVDCSVRAHPLCVHVTSNSINQLPSVSIGFDEYASKERWTMFTTTCVLESKIDERVTNMNHSACRIDTVICFFCSIHSPR